MSQLPINDSVPYGQTVFWTVLFVIALACIIRNALKEQIVEVDGERFIIARIDKAERSLEYRREHESALPLYSRGTVRIFRDGEALRAVPLRAECSPTGDLWVWECAESRPASEPERKIFEAEIA